MKLSMPDDMHVIDSMESPADKTLTFLLAKENKIFYYSGFFEGKVLSIENNNLRNTINSKKQQLLKKYNSDKLLILIKVTEQADFKNIVDCLDEMLINNVSSYMLLDAEIKEIQAIKNNE